MQRESWDLALVTQEITGDQERDIYAFVAELAGAGFADDEAIPEYVIDTLVVRPQGFKLGSGAVIQ